ncbi:MAG: hypothetical protein JNM48_01735 [Rhodospirillales bacterium]|nr:hypothetical protein [Rhodospirillales bacterium]
MAAQTMPPAAATNRLISLGGTLLLATAAMAAAYGVRVGFVEYAPSAWACQAVAPPWWCPLRLVGVEGLRLGVVGFVALACGLGALFLGCRRLALAAVGFGAAGLALYVPEPAAGGALLGAMALLRR